VEAFVPDEEHCEEETDRYHSRHMSA